MVTPYRFDAHLLLQKDAPVTIKDLTDDDIRILSQKKLAKDDYKKLSDNAITYMTNKEKKAKTERAKEVFQKESVGPSTPSKVAEYGLDAIKRGFDEYRERSAEGGASFTGGLDKLFSADPHIAPPIKHEADYLDPERNRLGPLGFDIKERATGAGEAALGPLEELFAGVGGIIETAHPPPLPNDHPRAEWYNKWRDRSKLSGEILAPIVPGWFKTEHAYGKPIKFKPTKELIDLLGGKINNVEKRFIETYTNVMRKEGRRPSNQEIADMVRALKRDEGKIVNGKFVPTHKAPPDIPSDPSHIPGFTKGELAKVQATDLEIAHYLNIANEVRLAGIGSDTFFKSSLGLRSIPEGVRIPKNKSTIDKIASWRSTSMTSGIMTAVRNAEVTGQYFIINTVERALRDTIRKVFNKNSITNDELTASWLYLVDLVQSARPARLSIFGKKLWASNAGDQINRILRANRPLVEKFMALSRTTSEVEIRNRLQAFISVLNNTQEYFLRRLAIEASLRNSSRRLGIPFEQRMPKDFSESELIEAFDNAFNMTMAKSGPLKSVAELKKGDSTLDAIEKSGMFKLLFHAFPRFVIRNMLPFVRDYSQFGYLKAIKPEVMKKLLSGDPEEFAKHTAKAYAGAMVLGWALAMRSSEELSVIPTEGGRSKRSKYYQWVQNDAEGNYITTDLRVISPTFAPHLFMAEMILHPETLTPSDGVDLLFGLRRWGTIGIAIPYDLMAAYDPDDNEQWGKLAGKALGEFGSTFIPQMLKSMVEVSAGVGGGSTDIASFRSEASIQGEDTAKNLLNQTYATFMRNVPYFQSKMAPKQYSYVDPKRGNIQKKILAQAGPLSKITDAQLKHLMGQRVEHVSLIQTELDSLKYKFKGSALGVPVVDNLVNRFVAEELTSKGGLGDIMKSPSYRGLSPGSRRELIKKYLFGPTNERGGVMLRSFAKVFVPLWMSGMKDGNPEARWLSLQTLGAILPPDRGAQIDLLEKLNLPTSISKKNLLTELGGMDQPLFK